MPTVNSAIVATVNPIEEGRRGQPFDLVVKVANYGSRQTRVDVWLSPQPNDIQAESLLAAWSDFDTTLKSATLDAEKSLEFQFRFRIPPQARSDVYQKFWV
ncbi:hypothetical protein [Baaleninema sp.]|uniref:hypothetical protein n=1 Tax=Baaleninema sp. TaxID=3101197 RepID=UPI003D0197E4